MGGIFRRKTANKTRNRENKLRIVLLMVGSICVGLFSHHLPSVDGFEIKFPGIGRVVLEFTWTNTSQPVQTNAVKEEGNGTVATTDDRNDLNGKYDNFPSGLPEDKSDITTDLNLQHPDGNVSSTLEARGSTVSVADKLEDVNELTVPDIAGDETGNPLAQDLNEKKTVKTEQQISYTTDDLVSAKNDVYTPKSGFGTEKNTGSEVWQGKETELTNTDSTTVITSESEKDSTDDLNKSATELNNNQQSSTSETEKNSTDDLNEGTTELNKNQPGENITSETEKPKPTTIESMDSLKPEPNDFDHQTETHHNQLDQTDVPTFENTDNEATNENETIVEDKHDNPSEATEQPLVIAQPTRAGSNDETDTANEGVSSTVEPEKEDSKGWSEEQKPLGEFGEELDLEPKTINSSDCLPTDTFRPTLELPHQLLQNMFHELLQNMNERTNLLGLGNLLNTVLSKIQLLLNPKQIFDQLDTIPGRIQAMLSRFNQHKAEGIQLVRLKLDSVAKTVEQKVKQNLSPEKMCGETGKQCMESVQEVYQPYQAALQERIGSCVEKVQQIIATHDNVISNLLQKSGDFLKEAKSCEREANANLFGLPSLIDFTNCAVGTLKRRIAKVLKPVLERMENLGDQLKSKLAANNNCFDRKINPNALEKMQRHLRAISQKCLQ